MGETPSIRHSTANQHSDMTVLLGQVQPHWYAAYTCANHEKPVAAELRARGAEHYCPLYGSVPRWKNRPGRPDPPTSPGDCLLPWPSSDGSRLPTLSWLVRPAGCS